MLLFILNKLSYLKINYDDRSKMSSTKCDCSVIHVVERTNKMQHYGLFR